MPDEKRPEEAKAAAENIQEIRRMDALEKGPRGNVASHDDPEPDHDLPPPMPG